MLALEPLQQQLQQLYEVDIDYSVDDFLIQDARLAALLDSSNNPRNSPEKLLIQQHDDGIDLSLYIDAEVIERLADNQPAISLHNGNLADYCTVLEGVSHFLYLIWNAHKGRPVSCLELEMQAEIDKFVTAGHMLAQQAEDEIGHRLHQCLFDQFSLADGLSDTEKQRYRDANHYAAKYCHRLQRCYQTEQLNELRRFYRLPLQGKIQHIERMQ